MSTLKVAVVQPRLKVGEVEANMARCEGLVRSAAREHNPAVILLPEGFTSPNMYGNAMKGVARPVDGAPYLLLQKLARELDVVVGGGFQARRGADTYGTYLLVEPNGAAHLHDKDMPSLWENAYYRGGDDDGISTLPFGTVGMANGFEWDRSATARRARGKVVAMLGGSCWWSFPDWLPVRRWFARDHQYNIAVAREMPARMARAVGAPVAISQHVGDYRSASPLMPKVPYDTLAVGESQIVERDGRILARMSYADGEGHVAADVAIAPPEPLDPIPAGFWMAPQTFAVHAVWHLYNRAGQAEYQINKRLGRHRWQGGAGTDLPDYVPPREAPVAEPPRIAAVG
ncbi:MAG: carbon-nitrogen hydrolase family protein [Sporichthyaceae bacterium]